MNPSLVTSVLSGSTMTSNDPPPDDPPGEVSGPNMVGLGDVPLERIETELCSLGAYIDAAICRWLGYVAEFDRRKGYLSWECRSAAHWLSWKCGVSMVTGREYVRVARALETLPRIKEEFTAGRLSYSKVRAITRIAHTENEKTLVDLAHDSTASVLDTIVRQYRHFGDAGGAGEAWRSYENREFSWYHDDNGDVVFNGRLPADLGAVVIKMIGAARHTLNADQNASAEARDDHENASAEALVVPAGTAEDRCPPPNADALVLAAESFLTRGAANREGSDRCDLTVIAHINTLIGAQTNESPTSGRPSNEDPRSATHNDGDHIETGAHIEGGPPLAAEVVRRLACDCVASIVGLGRDGDPSTRHTTSASSTDGCGGR